MNDVLAIDTETRLIERGRLDPDLACISYCTEEFSAGVAIAEEAHAILTGALDELTIVGLNFAYDAAVVVRAFPDLLKPMFRAYREGRIIDCGLNQKLIDIARGELDGFNMANGQRVPYSYSLAALHERHGHGVIEKGKDTYRLRYGELIGLPLASWPAEAVEYAQKDAESTMRVHRSQGAFPELVVDGPAQARAAFALHLMSCRGMITDAVACQKFLEETKVEIERAKALCEAAGFIRRPGCKGGKPGSKDTRVVKEFMTRVCAEIDLAPKLTDTGNISLDAEACRDTGDETLKAYSTFTSSNTILTRVIQLQEGSKGLPLQTSFVPLINNGRTSSRMPSAPLIGAQLQNLPRSSGLRQCFVARPGYLYCSVDYNSMEIYTFAQCEKWATGRSLMGESLNQGKDLHCMVAANVLGCSYEEVFENKKVGRYAEARQKGKMVNFGCLGGMGAKGFMKNQNKQAKKKEDRIDFYTSQRLYNAWLKTWEPGGYFSWVKQQFPAGDGAGQATVRQFVSGRVRGGMMFTEAANTFFSGLAADAAKAALWAVTEEAYTDESSPLFGSRPVLLAHDEIIAEVPEALGHESAFRLRDVMIREGSRYTPDFPMKADPCLMKHWHKDGAEAYVDGRLAAWDVVNGK